MYWSTTELAEWINQWMTECTNEMNERGNQWLNERMTEWLNAWLVSWAVWCGVCEVLPASHTWSTIIVQSTCVPITPRAVLPIVNMLLLPLACSAACSAVSRCAKPQSMSLGTKPWACGNKVHKQAGKPAGKQAGQGQNTGQTQPSQRASKQTTVLPVFVLFVRYWCYNYINKPG